MTRKMNAQEKWERIKNPRTLEDYTLRITDAEMMTFPEGIEVVRRARSRGYYTGVAGEPIKLGDFVEVDRDGLIRPAPKRKKTTHECFRDLNAALNDLFMAMVRAWGLDRLVHAVARFLERKLNAKKGD